MSREMYDFYVVNPNNGEYIMPNQSFVVIMGVKDDINALWLGKTIHENSNLLNKHEFTLVFIDTHLDPVLEATFD